MIGILSDSLSSMADLQLEDDNYDTEEPENLSDTDSSECWDDQPTQVVS